MRRNPKTHKAGVIAHSRPPRDEKDAANMAEETLKEADNRRLKTRGKDSWRGGKRGEKKQKRIRRQMRFETLV